MFERIECPRASEWDDLDPDAAADYRSHLLVCPRCAADVAAHRRLSVLLHEGDPSVALSSARSQRIKRDLLARCAKSVAEPPAAPTGVRKPRHWFWRPALAIGAMGVGAVLVGVMLSSMMRPAGDLAVVRATPPRLPPERTSGVTAVEKRVTPRNKRVGDRQDRRMAPVAPPAAQAAFSAMARRHEPLLPAGQRVRPSAPPPVPVATRSRDEVARPVERLVLDIGPRDVVTDVASVALVVDGSPHGPEGSVGVVYTHTEEKTP